MESFLWKLFKPNFLIHYWTFGIHYSLLHLYKALTNPKGFSLSCLRLYPEAKVNKSWGASPWKSPNEALSRVMVFIVTFFKKESDGKKLCARSEGERRRSSEKSSLDRNRSGHPGSPVAIPSRKVYCKLGGGWICDGSKGWVDRFRCISPISRRAVVNLLKLW